VNFRDFILHRELSDDALGDFTADTRALIAWQIFPGTIHSWQDLQRFLSKRQAPAETAKAARKVWREFEEQSRGSR
jgi:hypothetical protein